MTPHTAAATTTDQTPSPAAALVISITSNRNYVKANTSESSGPPYGPSIITGWSLFYFQWARPPCPPSRVDCGTHIPRMAPHFTMLFLGACIQDISPVCFLLPSCFFFFSFVLLLLLIDKASGLLYPSFFWLVARPFLIDPYVCLCVCSTADAVRSALSK